MREFEEQVLTALNRIIELLEPKKKAAPKPKEQRVSQEDFEPIYQLYPRKIGKASGMKRLVAQFNADPSLQLSQFEAAVKQYVDYCEEQQLEEKFIKHFSSFVSNWFDFYEMRKRLKQSSFKERDIQV